MPPIIYNSVGTLGVACILGAYFLLQTERTHANHWVYNTLNLAGACMILFSLIFDFNLPSFIVETSWIIITLIGFWRNWRSKQHG
jgi:hypothetical protein